MTDEKRYQAFIKKPNFSGSLDSLEGTLEMFRKPVLTLTGLILCTCAIPFAIASSAAGLEGALRLVDPASLECSSREGLWALVSQGSAEAAFALGKIYESEECGGSPNDLRLSVRLYEIAARKGNRGAASALDRLVKELKTKFRPALDIPRGVERPGNGQ